MLRQVYASEASKVCCVIVMNCAAVLWQYIKSSAVFGSWSISKIKHLTV